VGRVLRSYSRSWQCALRLWLECVKPSSECVTGGAECTWLVEACGARCPEHPRLNMDSLCEVIAYAPRCLSSIHACPCPHRPLPVYPLGVDRGGISLPLPLVASSSSSSSPHPQDRGSQHRLSTAPQDWGEELRLSTTPGAAESPTRTPGGGGGGLYLLGHLRCCAAPSAHFGSRGM
jgi:hypothetical protein